LTDYNNARLNTVFFVNGGSGKDMGSLSETEINAGFNLNIIADELKIDVNKILAWNPDCRRTSKQRRKYFISSYGSYA
jgi:membrane-bound lytic murein transglycosylase D